jgi:ADP-dependent NAD(P)H-hydrate dehydratase / NAD(P)H-hydrate epimerase
MDHILLSVEECYRADQLAAAAGTATIDLMEAAGAGIAREVKHRWQKQLVAILCGPGNNGGDGFVVARLLTDAGWPVRVALLGDRKNLKGDAAINAKRWSGPVEPLSNNVLDDCSLVIDGLFGAGLTRPIEGTARHVIDAINERSIDCIAIDVPSGVHGDTGDVLGVAPTCQMTVTFFRPKSGLSLLPGRLLAGDVKVIDIGIPRDVLATIKPQTLCNHPNLWVKSMPWPTLTDHKYTRGHAVISGGREMTGAARLSAQGARRVGAGLVTICSSPETFPIYATGEPGVIVKTIRNDEDFGEFLNDQRRNAILVGPGAGVSDETRTRVQTALKVKKATVLDADALTVFEGNANALFDAIQSPTVLTPHEGEFKRLFPSIKGGKLERAREAARLSGAIVLLKGGDTVVASPDGSAMITDHVSASLATAGSGDVLAGMILGLIAQGMEPFLAACAASWMHGDAGLRFGLGLLAEDIPELLPSILSDLHQSSCK